MCIRDRAKARNYDPTLIDSYRQVKAARKALDSLPPEEQLRKSLKQVPPPPTVNDPRPGFRLAAPPQRAPARLASGAPAERAFQSVDQPQRPNFPDRPVPDPHQTISEADLRRANETSVQRRGLSLIHIFAEVETSQITIISTRVSEIFDAPNAARLLHSYAEECLIPDAQPQRAVYELSLIHI